MRTEGKRMRSFLKPGQKPPAQPPKMPVFVPMGIPPRTPRKGSKPRELVIGKD